MHRINMKLRENNEINQKQQQENEYMTFKRFFKFIHWHDNINNIISFRLQVVDIGLGHIVKTWCRVIIIDYKIHK